MECRYCNNQYKNAGARGAHERSCPSNPNRVKRTRSPFAGSKKGCTPWNKGLKYSLNQPVWNKGLKGDPRLSSGRASTPEKESQRRAKISANQRSGGYRQGSGRGKKGWYKGFYCDSSWELALLLFAKDHGMSIARNTEEREYIWEGASRKYIPDFIIDGVVTEVKGFNSDQWQAKYQANPDVRVLYEEDMKPILTYVKRQYGKDFIRLYEEDGAQGAKRS